MIDFRTAFAIDKAANGERIVLTKRTGGAPSADDALRDSIASGLADDDIADKGAWINQQLDAYRAHVAKRVNFRKGATMSAMSLHDETIIAIAKNVVERGAPAVFSKSAYIQAIARRADEIKKADESTHQAFARAITEDDVGRLLYKASKAAAGPEIEPDGQSDYPSSTTAAPPWVGPAGQKMQAMADLHFKAHPNGSPAASYAAVFTHPDHRQLAEQVKNECLKKSFEAMCA